jgi:predicted MPP superfamily phosphohydrolase
MRKIIVLFLFLCGSIFAAESYISFPQNNSSSWNDGPYVFWENDSLQVYFIQNDSLYHKTYADSVNFSENILPFPVKITKTSFPEVDSLNASKIFALSDVHGQFEVLQKLLKEAHVIDDNYNWNFADGVLVMVGDIFDRGAQVNQSFWLLYKLRNQASQAGGRVIFLRGNHEKMIQQNDLRYVNEKYLEKTCSLLNKKYPQLYAPHSILGKWLHNLVNAVKINNILFVHAGIHPLVYRQSLSVSQLNKLAMQKQLPDSLEYLQHSKGPFWYRGYFDSSRHYEAINQAQIDSTLSHFKVEKIVVGHTTQEQITPVFQEKIIPIDAGLKKGNTGAGILIDNSDWFIIDIQGNKQKLEE